MDEKKEIRKNLKFVKKKKEQLNAANFLSKIEREQTAFVSYIINQFLYSHGITNAEEVTKEDAMQLFKDLKDDFEKGNLDSFDGSILNINALISNDGMKDLIEQCVKNVLKEQSFHNNGVELQSVKTEDNEQIIAINKGNEDKKKESPSRTIKKIVADDSHEDNKQDYEENEDDDEETDFEINSDLFNGLDIFFQ